MGKYSLDKPPFIKVLLNNVGTHTDPRQLVARIEPGLEIPGLRASLIQILRDYNLQVSLQEGCKRILVSDCYSLVCRRVMQQHVEFTCQALARVPDVIGH